MMLVTVGDGIDRSAENYYQRFTEVSGITQDFVVASIYV
jgi:hypothetical protein